MGKKRASRKRYSQLIVGIAALVSLIFGTSTAEATSFLNNCTTFCHGTPQRDAARKGNPHFGSQSSAFLGNHKNHLSTAPSINDCSICHAPVAATNFGHQNNTIEMAVKLKGYSTSTGRARYDKGVFFNQTSIPILTNATCSNVNCHFEKKTPVWGSAAFNVTTDCNACHGAPPAGTTVAPAGGLAGSHTRHDAYFPGTANCQKCHPNSTTFTHATSAGRALKVQGFLRDPLNTLEATGAYSGTGINYLPSKSGAQTFGSCSNLYCHSSAQGATGTGAPTYQTPIWGSGALSCGNCHVDMSTSASATGSHAAHAQGSGTAYTCDVCHGTGFGVTSVNVATHVNKLINLSFTANAVGTTYVTKGTAFTSGSAAYSTCSTNNCHRTMNPTWGANTAKVRCLKCHGYRSTGWNALNGVTATTDTKVGTHFNHISSSGALKFAKPFSCAECHAISIAQSTDNVNTAGHFDTAGPAEISFGALAKTNTNTPAYTAPACANIYCHGANMATNISNPPASRVASPTWNAPFLGTASVVGNGSTTPGSGDCSKCHGYPPMTSTHAGKLATACSGCHSHVNANGTGFTNPSLHINGVVDASGGDCTTCHNAQQGTGTRQVIGADTILASHHIQATTINAASCSVCHEQSVFGHQVAGDVAVGMFNQDTGAALTYNGTTATAVNLETSCNSCHDANGATRLGANALKPFTNSGDNTAPPFIGWSTGKQAHSSISTTPNNMACFNCHGNSAGIAGNTLTPKYNAHGSATAKMLQYTFTATDTMTTATNFCYKCHGTTIANGVVSPSIQATVALSTTIGHKSAKCADCHDQHSAKPGLHTVGANAPMAPVLNGVPGKGGWPATNPAAATTWTGTGTLAVTYTAKPVATKEYELCFKCHAGTVPVPTGYTVGALRMTDLGLEFNPANKSGHPIIAGINSFNGGTALTAAKMVAPWATTLGTQTMTCSDCHGAAGTGAKGPHGSSVRWMLTGTNQAWPFTTTAGNGTATGTTWKLGTYATGTAPNTLFCRNCHTISNTNTAHSNVAGGEHGGWASAAQGACVSCHIRIPHGGKVGRLIRPGTAALLGRYAPNGNGGEIAGQSQQLFTKYSKPLSFTGYCGQQHSGGTDTW